MTMFEVAICGPNLSNQRKGSFHVHAADCQDLRHYGPGRKEQGEEPWLVSVPDKAEAVMFIYGPEEFDYDPATEFGGYRDDFWFAPCCDKLLPEGDPTL